MHIRTTSKSALFLMELILAIFFFSLASAVCIQLFVKAHLLGEDTTNKSHGVMWAQNIAEAYLGSNANLDGTVSTLQATIDAPDSFYLSFDQDWHVVSREQAVYIAVVEVNESAQMNTAHIVISTADGALAGSATNAVTDTNTVANANAADVVADTATVAAIDTDTSIKAPQIIYELSVSKHLPLKAE